MKINNNFHNNYKPVFKGYDARPLKGLIMTNNWASVVEEMQGIAKKHDFKIFFTDGQKITEDIFTAENPVQFEVSPWAQDIFSVVKNKILSPVTDSCTSEVSEIYGFAPKLKEYTQALSKHLNLKYEQYQNHVTGGNFFLTKNGSTDELLIGEFELEKAGVEELKKRFQVEKVHILPQMDVHLDLTIRPLDNKRVLVGNDELTLKKMSDGIKKIKDYINSSSASDSDKTSLKQTKVMLEDILNRFENNVLENNFDSYEKMEAALKKAGYEAIKVPAKLYNLEEMTNGKQLESYLVNFLNASAIKNKQDEIVYITNKNTLDVSIGITPEIEKKIGFSFEKIFKDSVSKYIKPENIYFVSGDHGFIAHNLTFNRGGIHCLTSEVI